MTAENHTPRGGNDAEDSGRRQKRRDAAEARITAWKARHETPNREPDPDESHDAGDA